ncbi:hypothetical protein PAXRUDRAFT_808190 [Paxillus rubicundulus Ve08.2h10]|uniref:SHSP domain-containing protein n=1 Tax=Paxillus rubicundulus Ve08.2h10 TaxID=930991 RepID=A0A0D0EBK3_9AGAM|nr:hypothetical protein PAXRUDRAFT_808190 [Paxillus rubicundulus Ve08.2h10]
MSSTAIGTFTCWDGFDGYQVEDKPPRPPKCSRLPSTPTVPAPARNSPERSRIPKPANEHGARDQERTSLDQLWSTLRQKKHLEEAKRPVKVKSLETPQAGPSGVSRSAPEQPGPMPRKVTPPMLKKKNYHAIAAILTRFCSDCVSFRESRCGRTITATFDLPGVKKEQAHVSFRWNHLIVTWQTVKITETEEDGRLVREREEKKYTRTIPVPEGTKFEEIHATMDNRHLILNYPNMRTVRVEPRSRPPRQAEPRRIEPTVLSDSDFKCITDYESPEVALPSNPKSTEWLPTEEISEVSDILEY